MSLDESQIPEGFSRRGDRVVLNMSRDDWDRLLMMMGFAMRVMLGRGDNPDGILALVNRLNQGNPNFTPYEITPEADSHA